MTGTISSLKSPASCARAALLVRSANASCSSRLTWNSRATFSAVSGIESMPYAPSCAGSRSASREWCRRFRPARENAVVGLTHDERRAGHALDAAGDHQVRLARPDARAAVADRIEAGAAQPVDGTAGTSTGSPASSAAMRRDVAVVFAGLVGAAVDDRSSIGAQSTPGLRAISAADRKRGRSRRRALASAPP